ncbi:hypothetical protein [Nitrospira lenta]|uniref:PIN domain-containing protein n=1 Tax=Nitrospira lenta TaxID=1436998 RepID=A0A330LA76_9BACT|nr:hypothetical protein [Nitrospira lenta]SPP65784.1 hypothetical protein NITLEN_40257 [Nitrospira lenta]
MKLILPRFVAIDSSILAAWAKDALSENPKLCNSAREVQKRLFDATWTPIICLHHFVELARHADIEIGRRRIDFLRSFSQIAWIGRSYNPKMLGAVVDVFEAEVAAIAAFPTIDFQKMREAVRARLIQYGPPTDIAMFDDWEFMHSTLEAMATREQEVSSILHSEGRVNDATEIGKLRNIQINDPEAFKQPLIDEIAKTTEDLSQRGDARLIDAHRTAEDFVSMVAKNLAEAIQRSSNAFDAFVEQHDVPKSDITDSTTLGEFKRLARLRKLARVATNQMEIDLELVWANIRDAKIPSEILQRAIRDARRSAPRASGSDLGDDYLACLAPYVDAIIVDKRTHEFLTQAARRDPYIHKAVGFFAKATSYNQLPEILATYQEL